MLALDIIYFVHDNYDKLSDFTLHNVINNKLLMTMGMALKNSKSNDNANQSQKLMTELYLQVINLHKKVEDAKKRKLDHILTLNKYLSAMQKVEKIVKEANQGSFEYLKYLEFYKEMDKDVLQFLN